VIAQGEPAPDFTLPDQDGRPVTLSDGTWGEKKSYGRTYMGVQRATFVIDADGTVAHVIPKASPKTHDAEVLALLAA